MNLEWTTEKRLVKDLMAYEYNPRILTKDKEDQLRRSLEKFNLVEIPAINSDGTILAGHQRIKVLLIIGRGEDFIDVRVPNRLLTEKEVKEYNITSNVNVGIWDVDMLHEIFADVDLESIGLMMDEIVIPDTFAKEIANEEESDFEPDLPKNPITVPGDLYEFYSLSKGLIHRIHCADSTEPDAVAKVMNGKKIDLVITDPPYNVDYEGGTKHKLKIKNDSMSNDAFYQFLYDFYTVCFMFCKPGSGIYIFHADSEGANFRSAFKNAGFKLTQCLIWVKNSLVLGRQDYQWKHEPVLYGWKEGAPHNWYTDRKQTTVIAFDRPLRNADHPTMKPVEIPLYFIGNSSKRGNVVYDGFLGSGSTLIASEKSFRICYGQELGENYCDVIVRRYVKYMRDNILEFKIKRNGIELNNEEIENYNKS